MNTPYSTELFDLLPIVGILRGLPIQKLEPVIRAVRDGGLTNLEITMNTPGAIEQIRLARELAGNSLNIGAGTVTNAAGLEAALAAGAGFIVTPVVAEDVIRRCVHLKVPVFPGAFSPTEIVRAWDLGATMVKVFPAETLGPRYVLSIKAPFPELRLMPTGGVDAITLPDYLKAGADAFGIGSPLFRKDRLEAEDWEWLRTECRAYVELYRAAVNGS